MTREEAVRWLEEEIASLRAAPALNGCPMTGDWRRALEALELARQALTGREERGGEGG